MSKSKAGSEKRNEVFLDAVSRGQVDCARQLLVEGMDPNTTDDTGCSALQLAMGDGHLNTALLLLDHGPPPSRLESLSVHVSEMSEAVSREWLDSITDMRFLDLSGTPLSDAYAEVLPTKFKLEYLNVVDTGVNEAAVKRIESNHPKLRLYPNLKARRG